MFLIFNIIIYDFACRYLYNFYYLFLMAIRREQRYNTEKDRRWQMEKKEYRNKKIRGLIWRILSNYLILCICVVGFSGGGWIAFMLPLLQICLSWFNYEHSDKWQTALMLQVHLFISTVAGLFLEGYLFLKYISNDAESILLFHEIIRIGAVLVFSLGIVTTLMKYITTRKRI